MGAHDVIIPGGHSINVRLAGGPTVFIIPHRRVVSNDYFSSK
jgi:hypothetical protein